MRSILGLSVGMTLFVASACGGKVVFDGPGSGAGGGAGGSASTGGSCDALVSAFAQALAAAEACDPTINNVQCNGSAMVSDACGCAALANETAPAKVNAAQAARQAAAAQGCFMACGVPCQPAFSGFCEPIGSGATGKCVSAIPD